MQIWAAGYMPGAAFGGVVLLNIAALVITGLKVARKLEAGRKRGKIWSAWHQTLGLVGVALLPQVRPPTNSVPTNANEQVCCAAEAGLEFGSSIEPGNQRRPVRCPMKCAFWPAQSCQQRDALLVAEPSTTSQA